MALVEFLSSKLARKSMPAGWFHAHYCPGCKTYHLVAVEQAFSNGARWAWDGNVLHPTFSPSINVAPASAAQCHYFLRAGKIEYLNDCWHELRGKVVELPDLPPCLPGLHFDFEERRSSDA